MCVLVCRCVPMGQDKNFDFWTWRSKASCGRWEDTFLLVLLATQLFGGGHATCQPSGALQRGSDTSDIFQALVLKTSCGCCVFWVHPLALFISISGDG